MGRSSSEPLDELSRHLTRRGTRSEHKALARTTYQLVYMSSTHTRRGLLRFFGAALGLGTAGCLDRRTSATPSVSDEEAKERALAAEEAFLAGRLRNASCLTNWGTYPTTMSESATVVNRTADGVFVEVVHPYSYSTENVSADGGSNALYVVTADGTRRVRGDDVAPC
jgi:hypothetical protein